MFYGHCIKFFQLYELGNEPFFNAVLVVQVIEILTVKTSKQDWFGNLIFCLKYSEPVLLVMPHHFPVLPAEVGWANQPNFRRGQDVAGCYGMLMRGCQSIVCSWPLISPRIRQTDRSFISAVYIQGGSELSWMITYNRAEPSAHSVCIYEHTRQNACLPDTSH